MSDEQFQARLAEANAHIAVLVGKVAAELDNARVIIAANPNATPADIGPASQFLEGLSKQYTLVSMNPISVAMGYALAKGWL